MVAIVVLNPPFQPSCQANELVGGIGDILNGVLAIPVDMVAGTLSGPLLLGTVGGALHGTLRALGSTARGVLRLIGVAIPLAAKAAPLIPIFL